MRIRLAVAMMNQRKALCRRVRTMRVSVMAKAILAQLVATMVISVDVFCSRKKVRLASSVADPTAMVRLMRAPATSSSAHAVAST